MNFLKKEYKEKISYVFENSYYIRDFRKEKIKVDFFFERNLRKSFDFISKNKNIIIDECIKENIIMFYYDGIVDVYDRNTYEFIYKENAGPYNYYGCVFFKIENATEDRKIINVELKKISSKGVKTIEEYKNIDRGQLYYINSSIINGSKFYISKLNNNQWQHNYTDLLGSDKAFLHSDIIEHKGKIYFFLSGTPNNKTFCIDIETGKIEHTYKDLIMFSIPEGNLLYNLHNNKLNILNTLTQEIEKIDFTEELEKHNIETDSKFVVQNGLIYFTQSMGDIVSKVGILDPSTEKLIWKHEFPKGSGQVGSIQVQGNRIYVHTQDKTLHIFEKE